MTLYEECLVALGRNIQTVSDDETKEIFKTMIGIFPLTSWGRIDWSLIDRKKRVVSIQEAISDLEEKKLFDENVYILWDELSLPAVKTKIHNIGNVIYDVIAVSFDTWIFCPSSKYVIEFYHEDEITLGFGR